MSVSTPVLATRRSLTTSQVLLRPRAQVVNGSGNTGVPVTAKADHAAAGHLIPADHVRVDSTSNVLRAGRSSSVLHSPTVVDVTSPRSVGRGSLKLQRQYSARPVVRSDSLDKEVVLVDTSLGAPLTQYSARPVLRSDSLDKEAMLVDTSLGAPRTQYSARPVVRSDSLDKEVVLVDGSLVAPRTHVVPDVSVQTFSPCRQAQTCKGLPRRSRSAGSARPYAKQIGTFPGKPATKHSTVERALSPQDRARMALKLLQNGIDSAAAIISAEKLPPARGPASVLSLSSTSGAERVQSAREFLSAAQSFSPPEVTPEVTVLTQNGASHSANASESQKTGEDEIVRLRSDDMHMKQIGETHAISGDIARAWECHWNFVHSFAEVEALNAEAKFNPEAHGEDASTFCNSDSPSRRQSPKARSAFASKMDSHALEPSNSKRLRALLEAGIDRASQVLQDIDSLLATPSIPEGGSKPCNSNRSSSDDEKEASEVSTDLPGTEGSTSDGSFNNKTTSLVPAQQSKSESKTKLYAQEILLQALDEAKSVELVRGTIQYMQEIQEHLQKALDVGRSEGLSSGELHEAEAYRRKVYNWIQDVKGPVRVFCRIRPLSRRESDQGEAEVLQVLSSTSLRVPKIGDFSFDRVFAPGTQQDLFDESRDLVQSALDGHNASIFVFGQTGAGKTYTLYGSAEQEGIAPRLITELFDLIDDVQNLYHVAVKCSMFDLHNNNPIDLTRPDSIQKRRSSKGCITSPKSGTRQLVLGNPHPEHPLEHEVQNAEQLNTLIERGCLKRAAAMSDVHAESSRSHVILTIKVITTHLETKHVLEGKISFCDLAGAEHLKKTFATAEPSDITKSLTSLGDVIEAVAKKQKQISYKGNKLTQIMQDSIGNQAKVLMFINCSAATSDLDETLVSLKYAARLRSVTNLGSQSFSPRATRSATKTPPSSLRSPRNSRNSWPSCSVVRACADMKPSSPRGSLKVPPGVCADTKQASPRGSLKVPSGRTVASNSSSRENSPKNSPKLLDYTQNSPKLTVRFLEKHDAPCENATDSSIRLVEPQNPPLATSPNLSIKAFGPHDPLCANSPNSSVRFLDRPRVAAGLVAMPPPPDLRKMRVALDLGRGIPSAVPRNSIPDHKIAGG